MPKTTRIYVAVTLAEAGWLFPFQILASIYNVRLSFLCQKRDISIWCANIRNTRRSVAGQERERVNQ